jgi:uncharacterized Tic20 family protein
METINEKNTATFTHLSALTQYIIPFGNYIFPIIFWTSNKDKSEFVDYHGKQVLNFQLSMLLYSLVLALIAIPIFIVAFLSNVNFPDEMHHHNFNFENFDISNNIGLITIGLTAVFLFFVIKVAEFFLIINASIKASNGERYRYPLTISFLK